ncbi:MAG: tyrosine-type recombinase/integrase [Lachnospiraceae bacterium]
MKTLNELVNDYLEHCSSIKQLNYKTIKAYQIDLRQFQDEVNLKPDFHSKITLSLYITNLHNNYQPKTVKRKIASLKTFFHYLECEEVLDVNPFAKIDIKFREPIRLPKTIPLLTIETLLQTIYEQMNLAKTIHQRNTILRDITVLELLFATGLRISELCSLKPEHIDFSTQTILIYGKGSKERLIQIGNTEVLAIINDYYQVFQNTISSTGWFFNNRLNHKLSDQSVRLMIRKYVVLSNIHLHITPHMFRHSFATLLLEADVDIRYIQRMLGHSSITTTEIYTSVSNTKQRNILTTKHPRNLLSPNNG